jgi:dCMP deaminase
VSASGWKTLSILLGPLTLTYEKKKMSNQTSAIRPSWDTWFMGLAAVIAARSEDPHQKVGCIAIRSDNSVVGMGYNGVPSGIEIDWSGRDERRPLVIHAEANALRYAKPDEVMCLYVTLPPCPSCLTLIASYRIPVVRTMCALEQMDKMLVSMEIAQKLGIQLSTSVPNGSTSFN